jgi:hypothetical protein
MKTIEVCLGVGLNQLFPEYLIIEILEEPTTKANKKNKSSKKDLDEQKRNS